MRVENIFFSNCELPTIDLHSEEFVLDAVYKLERGLYLNYKNGHKVCRIIFGVGNGVLKNEVEKSLKENPLAQNFEQEKSEGEKLELSVDTYPLDRFF